MLEIQFYDFNLMILPLTERVRAAESQYVIGSSTTNSYGTALKRNKGKANVTANINRGF